MESTYRHLSLQLPILDAGGANYDTFATIMHSDLLSVCSMGCGTRCTKTFISTSAQCAALFMRCYVTFISDLAIDLESELSVLYSLASNRMAHRRSNAQIRLVQVCRSL